MPRPSAPSMPTEKQFIDAFRVAKELCPGVLLKRIGPDGIELEYPTDQRMKTDWEGKPFSGENS